MPADDEPRRGKLYTDLSKVPIYLSQSRNGFSLPPFRRWRAADAIAGVLGTLATLVATVTALPTGYGLYVLIWGAILTIAAVIVLGIVLLPWIASVNLRITQPARAEGSFFADSYQRRTGQPLNYVTGDEQLAPLVALGAPSRPHVYFDWAPERSPWASAADVRAHGGLLVWPAPDNVRTPPADLKAQFPDMVAEVPRSFPRRIQGLLPLNRLGWAMLRPQTP